ncbi:SUMF1/EgtB/PvdO family nonheme iron enzyme [Calothrix sp. 336/3]|uniref:SUMF1/EgtB/PvdO family nonheme iron enzyme n=1 Tax=Calothrix sp. 336/3 TaxID=1337936 RepID=UPI000554D6D8|nr:SUMF1/EgtB/PvdO family nonheme iron enzyme [Calothrix sp. 336/3]AKG22379.1 peptidase C14 [Calothrix sp. 336/3]
MGKNWAIAIGINNYDNLQPLKYAQRDAEVMATWFREEARFDQVFLFTENSPPIPANPPIPTQPTAARFRRFLNAQFEKPLLNPEDNLWFFFAGHGKRYNDQDYLMFPDSDPTDSTTAISVDFITQRLRRCGADNVVLLLDACRDEGSRGGLGIGEEKHQGVITFYSCNANQQSWEIDELQHGAFTYSLLEGLRLQGEGNCATVERLARHLYQRVPQINNYYRKQVQNPYFQADPPYKMYFILLRQAANFRDAQLLIDAAQEAELEGNLLLAENLWKRLWGLPGIDDRAFEAIKRIAQKQSSTNPTSPTPNPAGTTGQRSVSSTQQQEAERRKQQEAERKRQQQELAAQRQREQEAQKQREREETEARKQQQQAERERQQELDRRRKQQEAETRRQQREQQWQNLQQFLINRRQFLKWAGLGSGGLVTVIASQLLQGSPDNSSVDTSSPDSNSLNNSPPEISVMTPKIISPNKNAPKILKLPVWTVQFETVTVNSRGEKVKGEQKEVKFVKEDLGNNISLDMVYIPAGNFMMGSKPPEGDNSERPQQKVNVPAFCMGKYPVTQAQWRTVAALTQINRKLEPEPSEFKGDDLPVENVSWYDAVEFCARLSKETGNEYRLPSEAEWEYACRARTTTPFHFGETITSKLANYDASNTFAEEAKGEYRKKTTPVGKFPANAFGLYDMHGNVWEWCLDDWHDNYEGVPKNGSPWFDDKNNNLSQKYGSAVLRGGSWYVIPRDCRSAYRDNYPARDSIPFNFGFRVVCGVGRSLL